MQIPHREILFPNRARLVLLPHNYLQGVSRWKDHQEAGYHETMIRRQSRHREKNVTVSLRRCLFLYVAWLSQSAYDARMVNIAVGILLESVNHDMADLSVPNFVVGSKPPVLVRVKK